MIGRQVDYAPPAWLVDCTTLLPQNFSPSYDTHNNSFTDIKSPLATTLTARSFPQRWLWCSSSNAAFVFACLPVCTRRCLRRQTSLLGRVAEYF